MKHVILLGDGMNDDPIEALGGKTPLEFARTPNMDRMAGEGTLGRIDTIPAGLKPGSDVANLSVLGYDPVECYAGRGPLEAANMGVVLGPDDIAFRCNLVTLGPEPDQLMEDFTAGHISSEEAARVIADLDKSLGNASFRFYPGVSYRHLMVWRSGRGPLETTPPHDITGKATAAYLPKGDGDAEINDLMRRSREVLRNHPVSRARLAAGKKPPTSIWLWGQGRAPRMIRLTDRYGFRGGVISAVDLLNGIGVYAGLQVIRVPGATGYTDTDYAGKAKAALTALKEMDFVFVHVEAPDEMSHEGNLEGKIRAIEDFDEKVVGTVLNEIATFTAWRVMALSDHPTPLKIRTHAADPSAFAVLSSFARENLNKGASFHEKDARAGGILIRPGHRLMDLFIRNWNTWIAENRP